MIIGVDLDGVSGDYVGALRNYVSASLDIPVAERLALFPEPIDYRFSNWPHVSEDFIKVHSEAVAIGLYRDMEMIKGASENLWKLDADGHHVRIITSRFTVHGQNYKAIANTGEWLDKHDLPYRDIMFVNNKVDVFADIYIDDAPHNILNFQNAGRKVIIFEASYNRGMEGLRAQTWEDVYEIISDLEAETK
jgi:5'(3')-deoxyribonucleotidase